MTDKDAYVDVVVFCEEVFCFVGDGEGRFGDGKTFGVVYEDRILFFLGFAHLALLLMKLLGGSLEQDENGGDYQVMDVDQMKANKQPYHSYRWNHFMDLGLEVRLSYAFLVFHV